MPFEHPVQVKSVKCFPIALNLCLNSHENEKWGLPTLGGLTLRPQKHMAVNCLGEPRVRSGATPSQQEEDGIRERVDPPLPRAMASSCRLRKRGTAGPLGAPVCGDTQHLTPRGRGTVLFSNRLLPRTGRRDSRTPKSHGGNRRLVEEPREQKCLRGFSAKSLLGAPATTSGFTVASRVTARQEEKTPKKRVAFWGPHRTTF